MRNDGLRRGLFAALTALCLLLCGCRVRTGGDLQAGPPETAEFGGTQGGGPTAKPDEAAEGEPGGDTRENPQAQRKEYDENAAAEIVPGAERALQQGGEGSGSFTLDENAMTAASRLEDGAEQTATQIVSAGTAERMGVAEEADEADSAMTYYTVLLEDRLGSLFECHRQTVYWETAADHVTIFRTSPEHQVIASAGAYDVSARLLEENLRVDDGWIARKNPGVVVKVTDAGTLGGGAMSAAAAKGVYQSLLARPEWTALDAVKNGRVLLLSGELLEAPWLRTAAALMLAKTATPELFEDVDLDAALDMLAEEATGAPLEGVYYYNGLGGTT